MHLQNKDSSALEVVTGQTEEFSAMCLTVIINGSNAIEKFLLLSSTNCKSSILISNRHKASHIYTLGTQLVQAAEPVQLQYREDTMLWLDLFQ